MPYIILYVNSRDIYFVGGLVFIRVYFSFINNHVKAILLFMSHNMTVDQFLHFTFASLQIYIFETLSSQHYYMQYMYASCII